MAEKIWHENFLIYMDDIVNNPIYTGLAIERKSDGSLRWVTSKKSKIGQQRLMWAQKKALEMGFDVKPGVYAKVMYELHPNKKKVCQICGQTMELSYVYLNVNFSNRILKKFNFSADIFDTIYDVTDQLLNQGISKKVLKKFYIKSLSLDLDATTTPMKEVVHKMEITCREGSKNALGPGAMSNFPDRYDGFHTYNRCCRSLEDSGRSKENLKSYTKDRRAYENWSDGNIHAANKFMGSAFFADTSADHIGPISLGFIHDPRFLQPMSSGENSSKRDRLDKTDIDKLILLEQEYQMSAVSWFAQVIWDYIKADYQENAEPDLTMYRELLKENMLAFMEVLWSILEETGEKGQEFLTHFYLSTKMDNFKYNYVFEESGDYSVQSLRNMTDSTSKEYERFVRISLNSVQEFHEKDNRKIKIKISKPILKKIKKLVQMIQEHPHKSSNQILHIDIMKDIQNDILY